MPLNLELLPDKPQQKQSRFTLNTDLLPNKPKFLTPTITTLSEQTFPQKIYQTYRRLTLPSLSERRAKSQNIIALSKITGLRPSEVSKRYDELKRIPEITGIRTEPTLPEVAKGLSILPVSLGLATHPIGTITGLGTFAILDRFINLNKFVPEDASDTFKTTVELADFIGKGAIAGGIFKRAPNLVERYTKNKLTEFRLPSTIKLSSEQIGDIFRSGKLTTSEQQDLFAVLNLSSEQRKLAIKKGIDIEIPARKIIRLVDKPYWSKLKTIFGIKPIETITSQLAGQPVGKQPISGLLPEPIQPTIPEIKLPTVPQTITVLPKTAITPKPVKVVSAPAKVFKDKKVLLQQIQKAILKAPETAGKRTTQSEKVTFELDGGAEIFNNKKALLEFYNQVKKEPEIAKTGISPVSAPAGSSVIAEKIDDLMSGVKGYFTDGKLIVKGEPPKGTKIDENKKIEQKRIDDILTVTTTPAQKLYYFLKTPRVHGVSPNPIAHPKNDVENIPKVVFNAKGKYYNYDQFRFNVIRKRFPNAKFGIGNNGALVAYENKNPVAALMTMNPPEGLSIPPLQNYAKRAGLLKPETPTILPQAEMPVTEVPLPTPAEAEAEQKYQEYLKQTKEEPIKDLSLSTQWKQIQKGALAKATPAEAQVAYDNLLKVWDDLVEIEEIPDERVTKIKDKLVAKMGTQPSTGKGKVDPYGYQDTNQENLAKTGFASGDTSAQFEAGGDIFRELTNETPDLSYIKEKINSINRYWKGFDVRENSKNLSLLRKQWENQPVNTPEQQLAKELNLAIIDRNKNKVDNILSKLSTSTGGGKAEPSGISAFAKQAEVPTAIPSAQEHVIEMPEVVKLAQELLGSVPIVKRLARNYGYFKSKGKGAPSIALSAEIFKNPYFAGSVLSHEIGHLVDWLPTHILSRGGLLNRLLTVSNFVKEEFGSLKELKLAREERVEEVGVTNKELQAELQAVTKYWNPFDDTVKGRYVKYRYSSKELYAEAISVLLNDPKKLEELASGFYSAFWRFIDRKPEVKQALLELQNFLSMEEGQKLQVREEDIKNSFKKGEELFYEARNKHKLNQRSLWFKLRTELVDKNSAVLDKLKGLKINPEDNPRYYLEEYNYLGGKLKNVITELDKDVDMPLFQNGLTREDLGLYVFLQRVITERADIANPLGHNRQTAEKQLDYLKQQKGEKFQILETSAQRLQQIIKRFTTEAEQEGLIDPVIFAQIITNPVYAPFQVLDYLDDYITPSIIHQIGTLKPIANPYESSVLKIMSTIRAIERNKTRRSIVDFLSQSFSNEIQPAKIRRFGKYKAEVVKKEGYGIIKIRVGGKLKAYYVDPYIAESLEYKPSSSNNGVLAIFKFLNSSYFRPIYTTWNLSFQSYNIIRDLRRAYKFHPSWNIFEFLQSYAKAIPHAKSRVWGEPTEVITQMQQQGILSLTFNDLTHGDQVEEDQMEYLLRLYNKTEKTAHNPIKEFFRLLENLGNFIETLPKVSGYLERLKTGMPIKEIGHQVRVFSGSPDFLRKGTGYDWSNNIFLFSNAIKEGLRGDFEGAFTNPKTRGGYWWKTVVMDIIPKIAMFLGLLGYFGPKIKDIYEKATDYDKTNYTILPIGETEQEDAAYERIPHEDTGRMVSAIFWKMLTFNKENIAQSVQQIFTPMAGQVPSFNPVIELVFNWLLYFGGKNPYDWFRGSEVLSDDERLVGGWYSLRPMLEWTGSKMGVYGLYIKGKREDETPFEKLIRFTPIVQRFIRITSYGQEELERQEKLERQQQKARRRIEKYR